MYTIVKATAKINLAKILAFTSRSGLNVLNVQNQNKFQPTLTNNERIDMKIGRLD